jgi:hypothetical protein
LVRNEIEERDRKWKKKLEEERRKNKEEARRHRGIEVKDWHMAEDTIPNVNTRQAATAQLQRTRPSP